MINDTYACENDRTLNQLLKQELGFRGYVMSDWGGQMSTLSAMAGLDVRIVFLHSRYRADEPSLSHTFLLHTDTVLIDV